MEPRETALRVAGLLLDIGAVHFNAAEPYILTSGRASPVYIDCRRIISFLEERREIVGYAAALLREKCDLSAVDYIAGGETAGIAYAAWISELLDKPMLYIRKKPKGFGRGAQIEGYMPEGARVLLVEDLSTDGASKVAFAKAIREGGGVIHDVFSVFFYGIFKESAQILGDAGLTLHALTTWREVLQVAAERGLYDAGTLSEVKRFLDAPAVWSRDCDSILGGQKNGQ